MAKRFVILAVILGAFLFVAKAAWGGEVYMGQFVMDAGSADNLEPVDGGAFNLPARARLSVMCSADSYVCVDRRTCTSTAGVLVAANTLFPTSTNEKIQMKGTAALADGGGCYPGPCSTLSDGGLTPTTVTSAVISAIPATLGTNDRCGVWSRYGNEGVP